MMPKGGGCGALSASLGAEPLLELLERGPLRPQDLVNDPAYLSGIAKGWPLSAPTITT